MLGFVSLLDKYTRIAYAPCGYWTGVCPFCNQEGLIVSKSQETAKCVNDDCGWGGDAITFIMKTKKLGYARAREALIHFYEHGRLPKTDWLREFQKSNLKVIDGGRKETP